MGEINITKEEKDLLLKDLCARLSYGVKMINTEPYNDNHNSILTLSYISKDNAIGCRVGKGFMTTSLSSIKPYLFPLSSMTEEQLFEVSQILGKDVVILSYYLLTINHRKPSFSYQELDALFDWFNKNHFDYRGLIPKGLAIDATGLNIY